MGAMTDSWSQALSIWPEPQSSHIGFGSQPSALWKVIWYWFLTVCQNSYTYISTEDLFPFMTTTRSGLHTTPTVIAWWQWNIPLVLPPIHTCYTPPPHMHIPVWEASICKVPPDPPITGPLGSSNQGSTWGGNISNNNGSWSITLTPGNTPTLGRTPNPNPGGTPNSSSDLNPDPDVNSDLSNHESFQSSHLIHGRVPEPTEMIANAMGKLVDFFMKDKQEGKGKSKRRSPLTGTGYNKSSILNLDKHTT